MKKILFLGPEVTDFLNPIAFKLKAKGYTVDLLETRKKPRSSKSISESYSNILNFNEISGRRVNSGKVIKYLFTTEFYKSLFKTIFFNCFEGKCKIIKSIRNSLAGQHTKEIFAHIFDRYDIISFHSLSPGTLSYIDSVKPEKKIILSFWGSDLYQIFGVNNYYEQFEAMKRADIITVMSYEMELMVLSKFGSGMKDKIVHALFGVNDAILDLIDKARVTIPDMNFLQKYNISEEKIKITIGYCGNPICNHLLILNELGNIDQSVKDKIHLLVPMTYGNYSAEYMEAVKLKLNQIKINYTLFDQFLSTDELSKLRVTSDIMIMMNKSDGLSASVCEAVYADNLLISAIWLPYSPLRLSKIFFYETEFPQLSDIVIHIVNNFDEIKLKLDNNPEKMRNLIAASNTLPQWSNIIFSLS